MKTTIRKLITQILSVLLMGSFLILPGQVEDVQAAEGQLEVSVEVDISCGQAAFQVSWLEGNAPYLIYLDFGDGDTTGIMELDQTLFQVSHPYPDSGDYEWSVVVVEAAPGGTDGFSGGVVSMEGPQVVISSDPFPAVLDAGDGGGKVTFSSQVSGGTPPYIYAWDLDGDGSFEDGSGPGASTVYLEAGEYHPRLRVTDSCGISAADSIPVVGAGSDQICHPAAQRIAEVVAALSPGKSSGSLLCQDVYDYLDGSQVDPGRVGFGTMWKAYQLARTMPDLAWEDLQDWRLAGGGWGSLIQLNRFSGLLEDHSLGEMAGLLLGGEASLQQIRSAVRSATRYGADFQDALSRTADAGVPSQLDRFYQLAQTLKTDPIVLDAYLEGGLPMADLERTARFATRMGADWTEIAEARLSAASWGDINQAYQLASDDVSAVEILEIGVKAYQEGQRMERQEEQQAEKDLKTAEQLAGKYGQTADEVMLLFKGDCQGSWSCVRAVLRRAEEDPAGDTGETDKDIATAQQIAGKYGVTVEQVLGIFQGSCREDWACTRAYFRDQAQEQGDGPPGQEKDKTNPGQGKGQDKDQDKKKTK